MLLQQFLHITLHMRKTASPFQQKTGIEKHNKILIQFTYSDHIHMIFILVHLLDKDLEDTFKIQAVISTQYNNHFYAIYKIVLHISLHQQKTSARVVMFYIQILICSLIISNLYPLQLQCNDTVKPFERIPHSLSCMCMIDLPGYRGTKILGAWTPG